MAVFRRGGETAFETRSGPEGGVPLRAGRFSRCRAFRCSRYARLFPRISEKAAQRTSVFSGFIFIE